MNTNSKSFVMSIIYQFNNHICEMNQQEAHAVASAIASKLQTAIIKKALPEHPYVEEILESEHETINSLDNKT